ncbi:CerR family C-terminal domain-containing protein [Parasphingorhabdus sp.]|uniref:CerR family C-terminal domain-containing protein n=1 Tax=Parasphingorhabdus sp. TaxID=2709688 RepID=UPI0032645F91
MAETRIKSSAPAAKPQGYAKSDQTRSTILDAALAGFGAHGFAGATTRGIAAEAGVTLPSIAYHFGGKQGLYIACAEDIVARYERSATTLASTGKISFNTSGDPERCRTDLKRMLHMVLRIFAETESAQSRADFVAREMRERGPAFAILYERLWQPGVEMTARMLAGAKDKRETMESDRTEALMLISSLLAFNTGRDVSLQILGRKVLDTETLALLDSTIDRFVDALTRA